ncbi:MAG: hypothetical protein IPK27_08280 [Rhodanobacteraceae bacterium]|nr:hypothetical protein [Rhodanobacteraceae bacterium]
MSVVFEGILLSKPRTSAAKIQAEINISMQVVEISLEVLILHRSNRDENQFTAEVDSLSARLSHDVEFALLIRYDSRIGYRSSACYEAGQKISEFTDRDELYVPLNEDGLPDNSVTPLRVDQLSDELEYETCKNAIQLGLERIGRPELWREVFSVISE